MEGVLDSPRISFSHDLVATMTTIPSEPARTGRSDTSLMPRLPEPDFDFANAAAADVSPADLLFADGKLLPLPPLPSSSAPNTCPKPAMTSAGSSTKKPASGASPFSRSNSVNSAATAARRSATGMFCPSFPLLRSRSAGSVAAAAQDGAIGSVVAGRRSVHKKVGATSATTTSGSSSARVYYYGSGRDSSSRGVRVSPVLNVPCIGTCVVNAFSYLLCDCGSKSARSRANFGVASS